MEVIAQGHRYNLPKKPDKKPKGRLLYILFCLILVFSLAGYTYAASNKQLSQLSLSQTQAFVYKPTSQLSLPWPEIGQAAVGSRNDGLLTLKDNQDDPMPIASMAKIITALVVIDKRSTSNSQIDEVYTVSSRDVEIYNQYVSRLGSVMPVQAGQKLTVQQMLQGLMLPSGNNVADYLAIWTFGSVNQYVTEANQFLQQKGFKKTIVSDASGFSSATVSSPGEMVRLGQMLLDNPDLSQIVRQKSAIIPGSGQLNNTNLLLGDESVVGIKTGNTDEAGKCLIYAVSYGDNQSDTAIIVIMGQPSWAGLYSDARRMQSAVIANFGEIELVPSETVVANVESEWGQYSNLVVNKALSTYGWKSKEYKAEIKYNNNKPTVRNGDKVGVVQVAGTSIEVDMFARDSIKEPGLGWRLQNYW